MPIKVPHFTTDDPPRWSFRKWLRCFFTAEHWDPAIALYKDGWWRCKKCGTKVDL